MDAEYNRLSDPDKIKYVYDNWVNEVTGSVIEFPEFDVNNNYIVMLQDNFGMIRDTDNTIVGLLCNSKSILNKMKVHYALNEGYVLSSVEPEGELAEIFHNMKKTYKFMELFSILGYSAIISYS